MVSRFLLIGLKNIKLKVRMNEIFIYSSCKTNLLVNNVTMPQAAVTVL